MRLFAVVLTLFALPAMVAPALAEGTDQPRPLRAGAYGYSHVDSYTRSQTHVSERDRSSRSDPLLGGTGGAAPRVVRAAGSKIQRAAQPAAMNVSGVRVFRDGRAGPARPCAQSMSSQGVTIFAGCGSAMTASELAGGRGQAAERVLVSRVQKGRCARPVERIADGGKGGTHYAVCYSDLQPVYGARLDDLHRRIQTAARRACGSRAGYGAASRHASCEKQAVDIAVYRSGLPALMDFHEIRTGRQPHVIVGSRRR